MTIHATIIEDGELKDEISGDDLAALNLKLSHRLINMNNDISFADFETIEEDAVGADEIFAQLKEIAADHGVDVHRIDSVRLPDQLHVLHLDTGTRSSTEVFVFLDRDQAADQIARSVSFLGERPAKDLSEDIKKLDELLRIYRGSAQLFTTTASTSVEGVYAS